MKPGAFEFTYTYIYIYKKIPILLCLARELTAWMLGALLGENHMKDFDRIILVLFNW